MIWSIRKRLFSITDQVCLIINETEGTNQNNPPTVTRGLPVLVPRVHLSNIFSHILNPGAALLLNIHSPVRHGVSE